MSSLSDEKIIESCVKKGLHCRLIFERYQKLVAGMIWKRCGSVHLTQDLSQEVFLRVYKGLSGYRGDSSFKTWIARIVHSVCVDHYRKRNVRREKDHVPIGNPEEGGIGEMPDADPDANPLKQVLKKERKERVRAAMQALRPKEREALLLGCDGYTYDEIAGAIDMNPKSIPSLIFNAKKKVMQVLSSKKKGTG